ncbi:MAG TPA: T9SS type A sorting domain-containing protein [bacterium (Candidatus Stahlbacteria)]|nr:T9SS type A sorting domain-containing protein [Candidatus Stahlbacteria bacterium]
MAVIKPQPKLETISVNNLLPRVAFRTYVLIIYQEVFMIRSILVLLAIVVAVSAEPVYRDGILVDPDGIEPVPAQDFVIIKSFASNAPSYSMGLAFDGLYLWNDEAFSQWFGRIDTATGSAINTFAPTYGNRDMTFDGNHLWATHWQTYMVYKYDTSDCSIISSFDPPFAGRANGMAWDGYFLWVGEEGGQIHKMDTLGNIIKSIPSPNSSNYNPRGLAFDGVDLWVGAQSAGLIYHIDTTGTIIASYSAPSGGYQQGLTFDGVYLWSTGGDNMIYQIDISPQIEGRGGSNPAKPAVSIAPNLVTTKTTISFSLMAEGRMAITIVNCSGQVIERVVDQIFTSGNHQIIWERKDLPSGIYFAVVNTDTGSAQTKLIILD